MTYNDTAYTGQSGTGSASAPSTPSGGGGKKTGLIIGIAAGAVALIGIIVAVVLLLGGKNIKGAEEVSLKFMESFAELDAESMTECFPMEIIGTDGEDAISEMTDGLEEMVDELEEYNVEFSLKDIEITDSERLDPKPINEDFNKDFGQDVKFKNCAKVNVTSKMSMEVFGQTMDEPFDAEFTCAKIKNKWYIIDIVSEDDNEDLFGSDDLEEDTEEDTEEAILDEDKTAEDTEETTEAEKDTTEEATEQDTEEADNSGDDSDEIDTIKEALAYNTAPSYLVDVPEGVGSDLFSLTFSFDGKVYSLPCSVSEVPSEWVLNEEYFYKGDEELDPGDTTSSNRYENEKYDEWFDFYIATYNPSSAAGAVAYEDSSICTVSADINYVDTDSYPDAVLPKGITWGSSLQDIYDCYGEPYSVYESWDGEGCSLTYSSDQYDTVYLNVDFKNGLTGFDIYKSTWNE